LAASREAVTYTGKVLPKTLPVGTKNRFSKSLLVCSVLIDIDIEVIFLRCHG
jgi:hypothetical protein